MLNVAKKTMPHFISETFQSGTITQLGKNDVCVQLQVARAGKWQVWARTMLHDRKNMEEGDSVLVCGQGDGQWYVVGVLEKKNLVVDQQLKLNDGAQVLIKNQDDGQTLHLVSKEGYTIFQYDTHSGKIRLCKGQGDLELVADSGDLVLQASGKIRMESDQGIDMESSGQLRFAALTSQLTVEPSGIHCNGPQFSVKGHLAKVAVHEGRFTGRKLNVGADEAYMAIGRFEAVFRDVIQKTKTMYSIVEGLLQTRAGRMRTVVDASYHLKGENVVVRGVDDVKVKSDKIHLG